MLGGNGNLSKFKKEKSDSLLLIKQNKNGSYFIENRIKSQQGEEQKCSFVTTEKFD